MTPPLLDGARLGPAARSPVTGTMTDDFDSFFRVRAPALLRTAYLLTGDRHLAEDLVQAALARTYRSWRRLTDGGNPEAYVWRVMYNLQVSVWRRRRVAETMPGDLPERRDDADHAQAAVERMVLRRALQSLPVRQRAVIVLRYFEDRSEAEIAEILNCRVGTVKSHTRRGLDRPRGLMPEIDLSEGVDR
jgi:RNA polymerase sigma-70 factor (sigma-E family)